LLFVFLPGLPFSYPPAHFFLFSSLLFFVSSFLLRKILTLASQFFSRSSASMPPKFFTELGKLILSIFISYGLQFLFEQWRAPPSTSLPFFPHFVFPPNGRLPCDENPPLCANTPPLPKACPPFWPWRLGPLSVPLDPSFPSPCPIWPLMRPSEVERRFSYVPYRGVLPHVQANLLF